MAFSWILNEFDIIGFLDRRLYGFMAGFFDERVVGVRTWDRKIGIFQYELNVRIGQAGANKKKRMSKERASKS